MDHPAVVVEALQANDDDTIQKQQQQLVRERGRRIKAAVELGLARSSPGRQWGRALGRRALELPPTTKDAAAVPYRQTTTLTAAARGDEEEHDGDDGGRGGGCDEEEEEEVVEAKVAMLRQLVPGGEDMAEVEGLLDETADYIAALKTQVGLMRALACMLSGAGIDALPQNQKATTTDKEVHAQAGEVEASTP